MSGTLGWHKKRRKENQPTPLCLITVNPWATRGRGLSSRRQPSPGRRLDSLNGKTRLEWDPAARDNDVSVQQDQEQTLRRLNDVDSTGTQDLVELVHLSVWCGAQHKKF